MDRKMFFVCVVIVLFINTTTCQAQQPRVLWEKDLYDNAEGYTWLFPVIADVLGDPTPEIIVGLYGGMKHMEKNHMIVVLDGRKGTKRWEYELGDAMLRTICVIHDKKENIKMLAVGSYDNNIYIFNAKTGKLIQKIDHVGKARVIASADINKDDITDYVVVGDWHRMAAYDGKTGKRLWELNSEENFHAPIIDDIDCDESMEIITIYNGNKVASINPLNGDKEWISDLGKTRILGIFHTSNIARCSPVLANIDNKRVVVVGTMVGDVFVLDGKTGKQLNRENIAGCITNLSTGDLNGDETFDIIISSTDHKVYAVSGKNLEKLWEYKTDDEVYSSPALGDMDNDGLLDVVVVSNDEKVYCIDGKEGTLIWQYEFDSRYDTGSAFLADVNANGFVDVVVRGSLNGNLVVLETDARCEKNEILWPKLFGNNRNTGAYGEK